MMIINLLSWTLSIYTLACCHHTTMFKVGSINQSINLANCHSTDDNNILSVLVYYKQHHSFIPHTFWTTINTIAIHYYLISSNQQQQQQSTKYSSYLLNTPNTLIIKMLFKTLSNMSSINQFSSSIGQSNTMINNNNNNSSHQSMMNINQTSAFSRPYWCKWTCDGDEKVKVTDTTQTDNNKL
ncbi:hypothetical protein DFA_02980 [Cavenderia fasciculata]|uniref:Uncharacterized protein n=1 Tax=Cavenderia fasciculata TaxID=261658 RepID=F4PGA2_CACFS|nr:uncharacterized protein DFA_02980 [Cavenderia fasciculata]EGG24736.1 hypothetical protein DFA_02980 [Cavenderia fasciculata]|eukprot:XP_004362587.1 hypothetical protein DFA_02980 [Cavenderia fasciculata]